MRATPAWLTAVPVAHRGLHDAAAGRPENSLAAFRAAVAAGYAIELDAQLSADGVPVVFHDETLERLTGAPGRLDARPAEALSRLRLLATAETVPSLDEVLAAVAGEAPLLIELKTLGRTVGPLEAAVWRRLQGYTGPFAVQSFEPATVAWLRRHAPAVCRGMISGRHRPAPGGPPAWRRPLLRHLLPALWCRPDFIAYDIRGLPTPAVTLARRLRLPVLAWTVRGEAELGRARALADNVIFEQIRPQCSAT